MSQKLVHMYCVKAMFFFFFKEKNVMVVEEATIHKKIEPNSATNSYENKSPW
jgi:hypothetical protein